MDTAKKIAFIVVASVLLIALLVAIYFKGKEVTAPIIPITRRTCDFVELDTTLYAFCEDGSEFRIADQAIPNPKGQ